MIRTRLHKYQILLKGEKRLPAKKEDTLLKMGDSSHDVRGASYNQNIPKAAELEKEAQHIHSNPIARKRYAYYSMVRTRRKKL